jgi:uncharacterized protein DUF5946
VLPVHDGPTHAYIGASPACWALYGELTASGVDGGLVVDTYAVQHPGGGERRAIQSVALHLMSLCLRLERGAAPERHAELLQRILIRPPRVHWLEPPQPNGTITVADLLAELDPEDWARDVWAAWEPHHVTVRRWVDEAPV